MDMFEQEIIGMLKELKSELQVIKSMLAPAPAPVPQQSTTIGGESKSKGRSRKPKETHLVADEQETAVVAETTVDAETPIVVAVPPIVVAIPNPLPLRLLNTWSGMGMTIPIESALEKKHIQAITQSNSEAGVLAFIYGLNKESPDMVELSKALTSFYATPYRTFALQLFEQREAGTFTLEDAVKGWEQETALKLGL